MNVRVGYAGKVGGGRKWESGRDGEEGRVVEGSIKLVWSVGFYWMTQRNDLAGLTQSSLRYLNLSLIRRRWCGVARPGDLRSRA